MNERGQSASSLSVDEDMSLLAFDLLASHQSPPDRSDAPLFRALDALAVDNARSKGLAMSVCLLAAQHIKRVMEPIERAVMLPAAKVKIHRATRRQVCSAIARH